MKLRCAIIDDEPLALDLLESYILKTDFMQLVGRYNSAITAMQHLSEEAVDLLFLDIQMPDLSGMEFAKSVDPETRIVFTTAFSQYAVEGYRTNALDYLLKPVSYKDFMEAADKARQWFRLCRGKMPDASLTRIPDCFYVKSEYRTVRVSLKDILYIEGLKDYVKIYQEGQPKAVLSLMSMKALEEYLPSPRFVRIHRSYIVQMDKIEVLERGRIVFGQNYIPIAESNKDIVLEYIRQRSIP
ncbi:MAG: LytTR family DNA-binding domain-containing protein [Bacteroidales bacterium]|nr:LytTR family DNA-binding domain-containing protein [Bacteroidales bacterium]MCM1146413.1 LytTR family DNA-binding domain-containing protein [Bacteroidales bacterium]MCM1205149.1 LytTR family DNA-binding domain-containing protein [Bacillota bacterium]MCM1509396.1 LytTR family DNA-binding domain-containing protein [Clostridium sp.]